MLNVAYHAAAARPEMEIVFIPAIEEKADKSLKKKLLRVAAYCRVSTDHEEQLTSYQTQIEYYTKKIEETPNWKKVKIFADEGLSATSTAKRKEFLEMIELCKAGKIDVIITKSVSRFSRNTLDVIQYVRLLKNIGVTVIFEKENINTADINSETMLQLYAMFSQAESESISNNEKDGRRKGYSLGKVPMMYGNLLGYRKGADGEPEIIPEEAEIIIDIYTKYLEGWSVQAICRRLQEQGIKTRKGLDKWRGSVVRGILTNEKYKGDVLAQKSYSVDIFSKKCVKNTGELPMYLVKNHHIPIIDPAAFDKVQYEMARRGNLQTTDANGRQAKAKYSGKYALTNILVCGECGARYKRITWTSHGYKRIVWRCRNRVDHGKKVCKHSPTIMEEDLHRAIVKSMNMLLTNKTTLHEILKGSMMAILGANRSEMRIGDISNEIALLNHQIFEVVEKEVEKRTPGSVIEQKCAEIHKKIETLKQEIQSAHTQKQAADAGSGRLRELCRAIDNMGTEFTEYDDTAVRRLISKIRVVSESKIICTFCGSLDIEQGLQGGGNG